MGLGKFLKKVGKVVHKVSSVAAPIIGSIPGVGAVPAGLLGGLGALAGGRNLGQALMQGGKSAALAGIGGKALSALMKGGGASAVAGSILGKSGAGKTAQTIIGYGPKGVPIFAPVAAGGTGIVGAGGGGGGLLGSLGGLGGRGGGITGIAGGIIDLLKGDVGKVALGGLGAYQTAKAQGEAEKYRKKMLEAAERSYKETAPLRTAGLAGMTDTRLGDLSSIFARPRPTFRRLNA